MPGKESRKGSTGGAAGKPKDGAAMPPRSNWLVFVLLLALNYFIVSLFFSGPQGPEPISYTVFRSELAKGNVEAIHTQGDSIDGKFKTPIPWTPPVAGGQPTPKPHEVENFTTILPQFVDSGLETELLKGGVDIRATAIETQPNPLLTLLSAFGPAVLIIGLYIWFFRRAAKQGGGMLGGFGGLGKSTARRFDKEAET
jgi:cell division protease FtsH